MERTVDDITTANALPAPSHKVVPLAPAGSGPNVDRPPRVMPYACQTCAKRKVKCDKMTPICSSCRKIRLQCIYQAPPPRLRKRKTSNEVLEKLARYEHVLRQHGLLDTDASSSDRKEPVQESESFLLNEPDTPRMGRLLAGQGKSRYINNNFWRNLGNEEMEGLSDEEENEAENRGLGCGMGEFVSDPLTGALFGSQQSLLHYHPTHTEAMALWEAHVENVEPLCKILHIPSTTMMVENTSQRPDMASKADECQLFAIYFFAVFSMTDEECMKKLGESRVMLMQRYHLATRQALVNASFLKTTEMPILQALVLFLLACQFIYDSHTYWILTGVATRIAQRMGLHHDGEKLGLPPFDVQMRRRLFYQLGPLDARASQISGAGVTVTPGSWDTQQPLNINDDQIWPGMTEIPKEQEGATEMIFCLSRSCVGRYLIGTKRSGNTSGNRPPNHDSELVINEAECEVEEKFIRYCDIINPLHFLALGLARSGITAMRLRVLLPKVKNKTATDAERRDLFQLARKIMDTDIAIYSHTGLRKYRWYIRPFCLWGMWDSLIFILTRVWMKCDLLSPAETNTSWAQIEQVYQNHDELLESEQALYVAVGRLTLKAWDENSPSPSTVPEPAFITRLRSLRKKAPEVRSKDQQSNKYLLDSKTDAMLPINSPIASNTGVSLPMISGDMDFDIDNNFNIDPSDWAFWDQLIQGHQV